MLEAIIIHLLNLIMISAIQLEQACLFFRLYYSSHNLFLPQFLEKNKNGKN